ncbi:hypothetical protein GCM10007860_14390 [Chitiniphilus shinanonensis]|uniref:Uncharacterized protein n=1 Tax=Chitiniphilus shinanonensis TaxID=553088 RepID=A0ABQ6BSE8_9NEIS|nr:hypothetical protein [Chitiniphilus shinanonensis]GLS04292.1 hypothetical protein GCM10007860_14390 [Chitiniphilus shinanonensis]
MTLHNDSTMHLFEVIRWGNDTDDAFQGGPNGADTCFLVRADSVEQAAVLADHILGRGNGKLVNAWCEAIYLLGQDAGSERDARVLRGPYLQHAYCHGWRQWHRNSPDEGWQER